MQKTVLIGIGVLAVGMLVAVVIILSLRSSWSGDMMSHGQQNNGMAEVGQGNPSSRSGGMGMMSEGMFVTSERAFIEHMIPHHEEAIATAREVLERGGTTPGMVELANNIIISQTAEVALMKESYQAWFDEPYTATGEYEPMMRELETYRGAELDRVFLHDMTMHHMGAIMMSRSVRPHVEHDVMRELTDNIIVNQSREIETMRQLFTEL